MDGQTPLHSSHPKRRLGPVLSAAVTAGLVAAMLVSAPAAAQDDPTGCDVPESGLVAETEEAALALAAECGTEVEITGLRDFAARSYAEPDGTVRTEQHSEAQWALDEAGQWVPADPALEPVDGALRAKATVSTIEIAGGDGAFVTLTSPAGHSAALSWPEPLPAPAIDGDTAVFASVLPDVDLAVYAGVDGFNYALVVHTAEAAANPALQQIEVNLALDGLTVAADPDSDTAELVDADGEPIFTVDTPWMWDSSTGDTGEGIAAQSEPASGGEPADPGRSTPLDLVVDGDSLTVTPDPEFLADPDLEFPLYIDPKFTGRTHQWANLHYGTNGQYRHDKTWSGDSYLRVGFQGWQNDQAKGLWRSAIQFAGLDDLAHREVTNAQIWITQDHTGGCGSHYKVRLAAMDYFKRSTATWANTFNSKVIGRVATTTVPTSNEDRCGDEGDQRFKWQDSHLTDRLKYIVDKGWNTASFFIYSDNEGSKYQWRKLFPGSAKLNIWHRASKPTKLYTNGQSCSTSAPGYKLATLTPTLKATAPPNLASTAYLHFYLYKGSSTSALEQISRSVNSGQTVTVTVPPGTLAEGTQYRWRARIRDDDGESNQYGAWSATCYFRVNATPQVPSNLSTEGLGCGTQAAPTLVTTTTPKLAATPRDPDGGNVRLRYRFYRESGDNIREKTLDGKAGTAVPTRVDSTLDLAEGRYRWRVQTLDEFTSSAWSGYCWFEIDTTPPEPPDAVQLTLDPAPGDTVRFEAIGGSDVAKFKYILGGDPGPTGGSGFGAMSCTSYTCTVQATAVDGRATIRVTPSSVSIDHVLQVWALDAAGNESSRTDVWFTTFEPQPVRPVGTWRFDGDTADDAGGADLTVPAGPRYAADRHGHAGSALELDGTGASCAIPGGSLVDAADSFTLAAWVRIDSYDTGAGQVIFGMPGPNGSNTKLVLNTGGTRWYFSRHSQGTGDEGYWDQAYAPVSGVAAGDWVHLAGVYDAPAERLRLYVNGELAGSGPITFDPQASIGPMGVGCGATGSSGSPFQAIDGAVDDAVVTQQVLTAGQIAALADGQGLPAAQQAWWPLRQQYPGDQSGRGPELSGMDTATWVADQHGRAASALSLDGTACPTAARLPVRTDGSFTISAWVYLDPDHADSHPRVFSLHGDAYFAAMLKYNGTTGGWNFAVTDADAADATWGSLGSSGPAAAGEWTHLAVSMDAGTRQLALYVDGELSAEKTISFVPWRAAELVVGCSGTAGGDRGSQWEGAISDFRVWRGVASPEAIAGNHTARLSYWELDTDLAGRDGWGGNDLTFSGQYEWVEDRFNNCWAAYGLGFTGTGYATAGGPVLTTDESFTIAAWTKLHDLDGYRTIASQAGVNQPAVNLSYNANLERFQLSMASSDDQTGVGWHRAVADDPPELNRWYHLTAVVDFGTGTMRLYVNGKLQDEQALLESPWQAGQAFTLGAARELGEMVNPMVGVLDQVRVWSGVVDRLTIDDLAGRLPTLPTSSSGSCEVEEPPL